MVCMKAKPLFVTALGIAALGMAFLPHQSSGQAASDEATMAALLADIGAQQTAIEQNQDKLEAQLATIADDIRIARIFVGRGGGKATAQ